SVDVQRHAAPEVLEEEQSQRAEAERQRQPERCGRGDPLRGSGVDLDAEGREEHEGPAVPPPRGRPGAGFPLPLRSTTGPHRDPGGTAERVPRPAARNSWLSPCGRPAEAVVSTGTPTREASSEPRAEADRRARRLPARLPGARAPA